MSSAVAAGGVFLLAILAPFEMTAPLVRLPGQALTNLEAALLVACGAWAVAALVWTAEQPRWRLPLVSAWFAFVAAMGVAALAAPPAQRANAAHMTGRLAAAGVVYLLVVEGMTTSARVRAAMAATVASGVVVAVLAILEYLQVRPVLEVLRVFRPSVTAVGAQVRAGGSLMYPTIASMYLEVVFAFGVGLLVAAIDTGARRLTAAWFAALVVVGEAITLTFTRAGLITMAVSLLLVGGLRWRQRGFDRGAATLAALAGVLLALFVSSRPAQSLWLRFTSEGQDAWYRALFEAPASLSFDADQEMRVAVRVTNTGRLPWDSSDTPPILFSYHWLDEQSGRVVAYEGGRTPFDGVVQPGATVTVEAIVRAPRQAGRYLVEWDIAQEGRLWFSTEQGAPDPATTAATVRGVPSGVPLTTQPRPLRAVRPGRMVLWKTALQMVAAHPFLGVGPDNFRLLYGSYAGLPRADTRTHSNNMYLEVLVGGGIAAFALFVWLSFSAYALFSTNVLAPAPVRPLAMGIAAAGAAIALHAFVDSFLSFAPTYILFALTLGFAAALARGVETPADAHRV